MIKVLDNVFDEKYFCSTLEECNLINFRTGNLFDFNHVNFPFYMSKDIAKDDVEAISKRDKAFGTLKTENSINTLQWVHAVVVQHRERVKGRYANSEAYPHLVPMITTAFHKHFPDYKNYVLDRMKLNLLMKSTYIKEKNKFYNIPHIDEPKRHISIILYLSDSDGDTVFFKERDFNINTDVKLTEIARVKPKFGRMVVSDGHYHTSSNPFDKDFRLILNSVFIHPDEDLTKA